jgi:hypothetical protein
MANKGEQAASELSAWFRTILALCDRTVFAISTHEPHRQAAVLAVLSRNAKIIIHGKADESGNLYTPLCFVLAGACRRINLEPGDREWFAAITNVSRIGEQLQLVGAAAVLPIGTPVTIFKQQLDEALVNAGVTDQPTILDHHNRDVALGLAINWGLRFLVAYAQESAPQASGSAPRDLSWVKFVVQNAGRAA